MADFKWQGNSAEMFEKLIKAPPMPLRPMVKKSMTKTLTEKVGDGGEVLPEHVVEAVRKSTPPPFVSNALKNVVGMHSCATKCDGCKDSCPLIAQ